MAPLQSEWPIDPDGAGFLAIDLSRQLRVLFERSVADAGLGVTPSEARVFAHLGNGATLRQTDLAERLGIAPMTLIGFLDRLEANGLITRLPDADDRRAKRVSLTPAAEPVVSAVAAIIAANLAVASSGIAEADWEAFRRVAGHSRKNLARALAAPRDSGGAS